MTMTNTAIQDHGVVSFHDESIGCDASGNVTLLVIRKAMAAGVDFEDLADGFGRELGTMGGDWSGIRDSSDEAISAMFERAMNRIRFRV